MCKQCKIDNGCNSNTWSCILDYDFSTRKYIPYVPAHKLSTHLLNHWLFQYTIPLQGGIMCLNLLTSKTTALRVLESHAKFNDVFYDMSS